MGMGIIPQHFLWLTLFHVKKCYGPEIIKHTEMDLDHVHGHLSLYIIVFCLCSKGKCYLLVNTLILNNQYISIFSFFFNLQDDNIITN